MQRVLDSFELLDVVVIAEIPAVDVLQPANVAGIVPALRILSRVHDHTVQLVNNLRQLTGQVFLCSRHTVDPLRLVLAQVELLRVLDDIRTLLAPAVSDEVDHQNARVRQDRRSLLRDRFFVAGRALVLVVAGQRLTIDERI